MLSEIYIDNYRCLTNFRINPGQFQLWLGDNGSGKSTVFTVLRSIQQLLLGKHLDDVSDIETLTAWDQRESQTIAFSMTLDGDKYDYRLAIEYSRKIRDARIGSEELKWNGAPFFLFDGSDVHLYRINRYSSQPEEGAKFSGLSNRSFIPTIAERDDNFPLVRFRDAVSQWLLVHPVPHVTGYVAEAETRVLAEHTENFAEWYRHVMQEKPSIGYKAKKHLEELLPGFEQLSLKEAGQTRRLAATFRIKGKDREFDFMSLSDGQRQLIILYTLLEAFRAGNFSTMFIDEPDNFVSLREIRPWVDNLRDVCEEDDKQVILISHHPEIVNTMARGTELWFSRKEGEHAIVGQLPDVGDLTPAEILARGWENE